MFLVELVLQGVRGIRELARIRFQGGFNFVTAGNESGKTSSVDAMLRLLFPKDQAGLMEGLLSRYTPDASRAAVVAYADDGAYYRVIQDFSKRAVNLSKYNTATKEFALIYKDWDNTEQFVAGLTGGITEDDYGRLFVFRREHYAGKALTPAPAARRAVQAGTAVTGKRSTAAQEARLAELREALRRSEEAADADYRLQSAKIKLEEIKKKLGGLEETALRQEDLESQLAALKGCEAFPENLIELIKEHEQRQGQKMADSDERTQDMEGLKRQLDQIPSTSILSDKLFLAGAFVGVVSIGAGVFLASSVPQDYFLIGVVLSLLLAATGWYNGSRKGSQRKLIQKEIEKLETELAELEKSFEQGGGAILSYMKATDSSTTAELEDKATNYRYFVSLREDLLNERQRLLGDLTHEALHADYVNTQQEIIELEKAAAALAQYAVDSFSLRQDIERLEQEISGVSGGSTSGFGGGGQFADDVDFSAPVPPLNGTGFIAELEIAGRIGGIGMDTLVPAVEAAAQRNLAAVTGGKYVRIEAGHEGDPVVHAKDDSLVNFSELSHGTKDLVYFCLRTGLVEALAGKRRLPLILDDPLAGFDPARQQAACQILRTLGTKTQVILLTSNPALKSAGDAAAELK